MNQAAANQHFRTSLFDEDEWTAVQMLLARLSDTQKVWLSGYLAALPTPVPSNQDVVSHPGSGVGILICHGGETGNCESLAEQLQQQCLSKNLDCRVRDLAQVKARHLSKEKYLIVICSTHGDGDPPETVTAFYQQLSQAAQGSLDGLEYAVLALGDSSYEHFCKAGRDLDEFLARAGGVRLSAREELDVDFQKAAALWTSKIIEVLSPRVGKLPGQAIQVNESAPSRGTNKANRTDPGNAEILEKTWLSNDLRKNGYWHVELLVEDIPEFCPGDALGIFPVNPNGLVEHVLNATGIDAVSEVEYQDQICTAGDVLKHHVDLVVPSKNLLQRWSEWSDSSELRDIVAADSQLQREYLKQHQVIDLLNNFPASVPAGEFLASLRPLQPRLYDITNFPGMDGDELHLLVKHYLYAFNDREETGIASQYMWSLAKGMSVKYYLHPNKKFRLPEDDGLPLILIAHGSGLGPFRSFIQYFSATGSRRPCWIIFLEKSFDDDFLYQLEWQQALQSRLVTRFDGLFDGDNKVRRLSHFLYQNRKLLLEWIDRGAHFYLCGDRDQLKSCETDIGAVLESLSGSTGAAEHLWGQLDKGGQVHRNYY